MTKRVIVTTCLDSSILYDAHVTNTYLGKLERSTYSAIHPRVDFGIPPPHFGFLLVDEAAQATEPDVLCALSVVVSNQASSLRAHVTLCGDAKQLGPVVVSEVASAFDLDVSLLERLADRELYRDHPLARRNRRVAAKGPTRTWDVSCPFVNLTKNYRSATPILMLPSTLVSLAPFGLLRLQDAHR